MIKNIFTFILIFSVSTTLADQSTTENRIKEIDKVLQKHQKRKYFYESRNLINLMNERECLSSGKSESDCKSSMEDISIGDLAKQVHQIKSQINNCKKKSCKNLNNLLNKKREKEATYKIKLVDFLANNLEKNTKPFEIGYNCLPTPKAQQNHQCYMPEDGSLPTQMGINLTAPQAESPAIGNAMPFANIFKTARPFESDRPDLVKNKNGWPCFNKAGEKIKTNILQSAKKDSVPNGIYPFHYSGNVNISVKGADLIECPDGRRVTRNKKKRKCLKVNIKDQLSVNGIAIEVQGREKGACLEDLKVILPGGQPNYEKQIEKDPSKIVFNKDYIDYLGPFKVLRMMNLMYASPRLPDACRKIQEKSIASNPSVYSWNNLSPQAKDCTTDTSYNRTPSNRAKLSDATWGVSHDTDKRNWRGVPMEVMTELVKQTGANPWINIPHNASPEYIREMAKQLAEVKKTNPNIKIHVEYSNEVWNGRFWGAKYIQSITKDPHPNESRDFLIKKLNSLTAQYQRERKRAESSGQMNKVKEITERFNGLKKPYRDKLNKKVDSEVESYVNKSLEVFEIFEQEIGAESLSRTLGTNQKDPNRTKRMLTLLKEKGRLDQVDAVATATYFHSCWGSSQREGTQCQKFLKESKKKGMYSVKSEDQVLDLLLDKKNPEGVDHVISQVKNQQGVLDSKDFKEANIDLVAYEGGQHLTLDNMPADLKASITPAKKKELIKLIHKANNHPKMAKIYEKLYEGWKDAGGKTHVNFIMAQSQSQYGSFGMSTHLNDGSTSAKYSKAKEYSKKFCSNQK